VTPAVAARAVALPEAFPRDPFDRIIFATAVEHGLRLVTHDEAIRQFDAEGHIVIW
jgi:PIN domain nuclease of toxin-antitoxin system